MFVYELSGCRFKSRWCHLSFRYCACFGKKLIDIQATIWCRFTLKRIHDMIITHISSDEIYFFSTIKICGYFSFVFLLRQRSWSCLKYQKRCCYFVNCYYNAKKVQKKKILFSVSCYCTLLFSRTGILSFLK